MVIMITYATSTGDLAVGTTSPQAQPAALTSITLSPAAAASSVTIFDNASAASGTIIGHLVCPASVSSVTVSFTHPVRALKGLTVTVAGTGATANVGYVLY